MRKIIMAAAFGCAVCAHAQETKWEWAGWGGGGFFWAVAWDPSDENVLYMGGDVIGIYKSIDRGLTWRIVNDGLQDYGVYTLAVSYSNAQDTGSCGDGGYPGVARQRNPSVSTTGPDPAHSGGCSIRSSACGPGPT